MTRTLLAFLLPLVVALGACSTDDDSDEGGDDDGDVLQLPDVSDDTALGDVATEDTGGQDALEDTGGDSEPDVPDDSGSTCFPEGTVDCPIVIDTFPYMGSGDTRDATESNIDSYACAPSTDESGPELYYDIIVPEDGVLTVSLDETSPTDVDIHLLSSPSPNDCLTRGHNTVAQLVTAGTYHLVIDTFNGDAQAGPYDLEVRFVPGSDGLLGPVWITYYYLAEEADHSGPKDTPIYDDDCNVITNVPREFHDDVCIEGSGLLDDGTVINYASTCTTSCPDAVRCGSNSYRICWLTLDPDDYPYGAGVQNRPLVPDRSIAVDTAFIPIGSSVYLAELDGVVPPGGTEPHDGCMVADDIGGAIDGNHIDFFSGTRARWFQWEEIFPTRTNFTAYLNHDNCR